MPVRLVRPYNGQNANTVYSGMDEAILRAIGIADDYVELADNYVPRETQAFRAFANTFSVAAPAGQVISTFSNPFAGQGRGVTTYALTGTVPGQIALSATGRSLVVGASAATAGTIYTVNVVATSGDGLLTTQPATFSFGAVARLNTAGGTGGSPPPFPGVTPVPGVAFTMSQLGAANRVYQRATSNGGGQGRGTGTIPVTINATALGTPYFRIRGSDGTTILQSTTVLPSLTATGSQTLNVIGVDARLGWFYVDLSNDSVTWQNGTTLVGMGRIIGITGQSQAARLFGKISATAETNASLGVAIDPNSAVYARYTDPSRTLNTPAWAIPADGTNYDSTFTAEFLRRQVAFFGVNCAQVGHANGGTTISGWLPGQTNNTNLRAVLDAVGGFEAYYWNQGGDDAGAGTSAASYQASLTTFFNDVASRNTIRGSTFERYVTTMGTRLAGGVGTTSTVQTIRKAALDWSAANGAAYLEPHDILLEDDVHQIPRGNLPIARALHRATTPATNNGPSIVSGTRSGAIITLSLSAPVTVLGSPIDRFSIYANGTTTSPFAVSSVSANGSHLTVTLSADPGNTQALDVYWLRHPDPSGTTADANMIYDTYTADGIPTGRQLQPTLSGAVAIAAVGGVTTLNALTVSNPSATAGTPYTGTISGLTAGSTPTLTGAGAPGLSISGSTIGGTPTTAGTVNIVETLAGATNSPRTSSGVVTVAAASAAQFTDTFTGADGTDMTARSADTGQTYTKAAGATGSIVINNNEAATGDTLGSVYLSSLVPASANYTVSAKFKCISLVADAACYVLGRLSMSGTSRTNYQAGYSKTGFSPYSAEGIYFGKTVSGTFTALGFYAYTAVAGAAPVIAMSLNGSNHIVTLDGATIITATDTAITAAGTIGMRFTGQTSTTTGFHLDNLTVV